jgi:PAS domain S-box-containing protein
MPVLAIGLTALLLGIAYVCWRTNLRLAAALADADLYRDLFNSSADAIFLCDAASGRILRANQPFATLYGFDGDTGQLSLAAISAGEAPYSALEAASWIEKAERDGPQLFEWRARRRDGELIWVEVWLTRKSGGDGRLLLGTLRDISARKLAEAHARSLETRQAQTTLIEERNFLNSLLEAIPLPVFYKDRAGVYLGCNEAFLAGTGRTRDGVIGKTVFDMAPVEIARRYQQMDDELFAAPGRQVYEWLLKRPSGEERNAVFNKATFTHQNGEIGGLIGVILDVTELKQAQQRLEELNHELEQRVEVRTRELRSAMRQLVQSEKIAALGHLVAGVAHELNTPIGTMLTLASAFEDRLKTFSRELDEGKMTRSAATENLASMITAAATLQRNAHRAAELVASFKQVAVDQASTRRRSFDLAQTVAEVLQTLAPLLRHQSGIEVSVDIPGGLVLDSFPGPLEQVLTNLFTNSLAHGFEHHDRGRIEITGRPHEGSVVLRYADNGKGIEAKLLDRIFDPFFTTKLGQGGSGLGLYIVYNLVTGGLGGRLHASSEPGAGACFEIVLPLSAPEPRPAELPWPKREPAPGRDDYVI